MIWRTRSERLAPPAHHHRVAGDALQAHRIDDVREPIGEAAQCGDEDALDLGVEVEPGDHRARARIGMRRAVAHELGQDVQATREIRRLAQCARADCATLE